MPTSNRFQILENNGEICNSDKSSHAEGNSAFQTELENIKLRRKVHDYLENQLSQNNRQPSQSTSKAAESENNRKVEDHTEQVKNRPLS